MRRLDALTIILAVFIAGGFGYVALQWVGLDGITAGIWTQAFLVMGLVGWLLSYVLRAMSHKMTYHQQLKDYEEAIVAKRYSELSPEELGRLQAEVEAEQIQAEQLKAEQAGINPVTADQIIDPIKEEQVKAAKL